jgi:redox-sensitive bicupin YhaK (pirin superfamily)
VRPGWLAYLGIGRDEIAVDVATGTRLLLIGGAPFREPLLMWWNYVARTRDEIVEAHRAWTAHDSRFGAVASPVPRIDAAPPPW